jgi:hypothetical protein
MGRVLLGAGLMAAYLVTQGIVILYKGNIRGIGVYFGKPPRSGARQPAVKVVPVAAMHILPGAAVFALLIRVAVGYHLTLSEAAQHLWAVWQPLLFVLSFLLPGIYGLIRPSRVLDMLRDTYPDIPEDYLFGRVIVRIIAAGFCFISLAISFAVVS